MKKGELALKLRADGKTNAEIAAFLNMKQSSVRRLISETKKPLTVGDVLDWGAKFESLWHKPTAYGTGTVPNLSKMSLHLAQCEVHGMTRHVAGKCDKCESKKPTHLIIPDTQCKPGVPLDHLFWAGKYIADKKPDVVVHLGDHWDLASLSSYEGRGSRYFEGKRLKEDIEAGNRGLDLLMKGMGDFRPKRMVMLRGNHEDRLTRAINESPTLLEGLVGFEDFNDVAHGWEVIDYLKPIEIDGIWYCHYFYHRNTGRAYSGSMDSRLRAIGHSFSQGHQQGLQWGRRELNNGTAHVGLVAGSYYLHSEEYRGTQANNEWRGLVVKHEVGDGTYDPMFVSLDFLRRTYS